jgi:hypothetical protein
MDTEGKPVKNWEHPFTRGQLNPSAGLECHPTTTLSLPRNREVSLMLEKSLTTSEPGALPSPPHCPVSGWTGGALVRGGDTAGPLLRP